MVGFIVLIIGVLSLAIVMIIVASKLLSRSEMKTNVDYGDGQNIPTSTNPRDVQNKVNDLQNQLQQKQNQSLGGE